MAKSKNHMIGLVLGSAELRAAQLSADSPKPRATASGRIALPAGLITDGVITDVSALASLIEQLLRSQGFSGGPLLVGIKGQHVLLRMATFPKVPDDKIKNAILYQAQQFIPVPVGDLVLDYVLCGDLPNADPPSVNVLLVGAKRVFLDGVIEAVRIAGRELVDIDSAQLALVRAASSVSDDLQEPSLLAEADAEAISMTICRGDTILMTRTVPLPAQLLQSGLQDSLSLDQNAREALVAQLILDIGASVRYFSAQRGEAVRSVRLTGSYDNLEQISQSVGERLEIPTRVFAPYSSLEGADPRRYAACISLALRGMGGETR